MEPLAKAAPAAFKCTACGKCCKEFYRNRSYGPFFILDNGLPLNLVEKEIFEREAAKQGKKPDLRWSRVLFDELSGKVIGLTWCAASEPCLFLRGDNLCANYEHRPVYCRSFPVRPAFVEPDNGLVKFAGTSCPDDFMPDSFPEHRERLISNRELAQAYHKYYSDDYVWARVKADLEQRLQAFLKELTEKGVLKPALASQATPELEGKVRGMQVVALDDFLAPKGKGFSRESLREKLFAFDFEAMKKKVLTEIR